jgi:hypothetical protein
MPSIQIECDACNSTGLYCGFAEPKGTAVICYQCNGSGARTLSYKEYTGRKRRRNIQRVLTDGGLWMTRTKSEAPTISIKEFNKKVPEASRK